MQQNRICLNAVNPKIHDSLSEDRLIFSSAGAQPISPKLLKGLGCCPTSFCTSGYRRALLARTASSGVGTHRICLLFCKKIPVVPRRFCKCTYTCCACYSLFPMLASAISLNGNRRQPPSCLPKSETDGRCQWRRSRSS